MANLTASISHKQAATMVAGLQVPIFAAAKIYQGAMVCLRTADGYAVRAGTANTGRVAGVAQAEAATPTNSGDANVNLMCGVFSFAVHASHTPTIADVLKSVYASDDNTISNLDTDGPIAGTLIGFEARTGNALVHIAPGAATAGAGSFGRRAIPLYGILAAGTPMAAAADSASSAPGITLADSKAMGIRWNDAATQVAVFLQSVWPDDMDTSVNATVEVIASKTGATLADAVTFTITAFKNAVGALDDADTDFGGASSAMTGDAAAKTVQKVTLALAAANLGVPGEPFTMSIKPTNGTLGTDDVVVEAVVLKYKRK